jgi:Icc-related predicted phosphoesterase
MKVYFCTDIHGSDKCWKKFLAAPKFYGADVIIMGGDMTGKFIIPIVQDRKGRYTCRFAGMKRKASSKEELAALQKMIADSGAYSYLTTDEEVKEYEGNQPKIDKLFHRLIMERVDRWVEEAETKLAGTGVRVFASGANDDFFDVDQHLAQSALIEDPNGTVIDLDEGFQIIGMGYGNKTPWNCPRDIDEDELAHRIDDTVDLVRDPSRTIMSLHVPPLGSQLDLAPELSPDLQLITTAGGLNMIPVGSTAVHDAILKYKPFLGLHGHIHESRGVMDLGGVPILNPGSEYSEGMLDGAVLDVSHSKGLLNVTLVKG